MTTADWVVIATHVLMIVPPTIASVASLIVALRTHKVVNSRMSELLAAARKEALEEGAQAERDKNA